jgi:hypothetical protein
MKTKFNLDSLVKSVKDTSKEIVYFLDRQTGEILVISLTNPDVQTLKKIKDQIAGEPGRFPQIPRRAPREGYKDMEEFIATVTDPKLKRRLAEAIEGQGAFKCFRDVIETQPLQKQKWNSFSNERVLQFVKRFLREIGVPMEELP